MKIGLIDVDGHNFPNLPLMKLSAWHKANGDSVEWYSPDAARRMDRVYMSKVFSFTPDYPHPVNAFEVVKGGSGYCIDLVDGKEVFDATRHRELPFGVEHIYPDYSLYGITDTAYGFLSRGCPRGCHFCIVAGKEGRRSEKVANLREWWRGQQNIVLLDPNLLACPDRIDLLRQLVNSQAVIDINQGLDCRLLNEEIISYINRLRIKDIHFAWDYMKESDAVLRGLTLYTKLATRKPHGKYGTVYTLTNYDTSMEENLYRIYTLRDMGFDPYVMIYDKKTSREGIHCLNCNDGQTTALYFQNAKLLMTTRSNP